MGGTTSTAFSGAVSTFLGAALSPTIDGTTVARIRGRFLFQLITASAIGDGLVGAFGIGLASLAAVTAGAASVPTPIQEQAADSWLFWTPIQAISSDASDTGLSNSSSLNIEVDTKAMRKWSTEDALYAVVEIETEEGTATAEAWFDSRTLLFLP